MRTILLSFAATQVAGFSAFAFHEGLFYLGGVAGASSLVFIIMLGVGSGIKWSKE